MSTGESSPLPSAPTESLVARINRVEEEEEAKYDEKLMTKLRTLCCLKDKDIMDEFYRNKKHMIKFSFYPHERHMDYKNKYNIHETNRIMIRMIFEFYSGIADIKICYSSTGYLKRFSDFKVTYEIYFTDGDDTVFTKLAKYKQEKKKFIEAQFAYGDAIRAFNALSCFKRWRTKLPVKTYGHFQERGTFDHYYDLLNSFNAGEREDENEIENEGSDEIEGSPGATT